MKSLFRSLSIKAKMFFTFAGAYTVMITIIGVAIYISNVNQMKNQTYSLSKVLSAQFSRTVDLYFQDIERLSLAIFTDSYIQEALSNYEGQSLNEDVMIRNSLYPRLFNQAYPHSGIEGITIYTNEGTSFYYEKSGGMEINNEPMEKEWMAFLNHQKKDVFSLLPSKQISMKNGDRKWIVSLVRNIYNIPQRKKIGSLKIDINIDVFEKLLEIENVEELENHLRILVLSENQTVIYDHMNKRTGEQQIGLNLLQTRGDQSKTEPLNWGTKSYLYTNDYSSFTNWDTIVLIDNEFLQYERNQIMLFIGISGLVAISIIAFISYLLSHHIAKPYIKLMKKMKRVEEGDLTERMELIGNTEIDVMTRVYNNMLDSINQLITGVYESTLAEKNAKISALQSQINPHFLYNTLNVMKSISRVKGVEEVAEISESLADLFKYSMRDLDKQVHLFEELNHIDNYMKIQSHRFKDRFTLEQWVSDEAKQARIPKLLIQPLVENAVTHGLRDKRKGGVIQLNAYENNDQLMIEVCDNGIGMTAQTLEKVKKKLNSRIVDSEGGGLGLHNIAQRMKLMYGHHFGIEMESRENIGTRVQIVLPFQTNKV
ncbi:sensor histidine kinase [Lederbergia sp. NSJ-179]|uniref:cache domain-containing sensor histidine kinase n=1 Tax=Lederbergia sp. NSJ-179 TaxID=2931402 RepID=UPI001FD5922A|nr:sensor histidine kinase [Lederbergia sp. NSJ-179]MCJ7843196.1 sensor histidine kinase [Lederbergia sp. NSJ-179]